MVREALVSLRKRGFNRLYQGGRVFEFSTPEDLLDVDFAKPVYVLVDRLALSAGYSFAPDGFDRDLLSRGERRGNSGICCRMQTGGAAERMVFNERFECKKCGAKYQEPEPRLFSFNNPYGACPRCQGFGNTIDFDLDRVIPDKGKSLADGAIEPWTKPRYRQLGIEMQRFARAKGIPLDVPYRAAHAQRSAKPFIEGERQRRFPGREGIFRMARTQEIQAARARVSEPLSRLRDLPGLPRHAAARGSARGENLRPIDHRSLRA